MKNRLNLLRMPFLVLLVLSFSACVMDKGLWGKSKETLFAQEKPMKELNEEEKRVLLEKGTEAPFTGKYNEHEVKGTYVCKQCGAELYESTDKFKSNCGWPSFDGEIVGAVTRVPDGNRTEIVCASCQGHLGHVFEGEQYTDKNIRHCVNSISLDFVAKDENQEVAIFAGGCFWGVEYFLEQEEGVVSVESGYIGGVIENPTYQQISTGETLHAEAVEVIYDKTKVSYETLARLFFEIHDPTQKDRQGPDVGNQYRSEIYYTQPEHKEIAEKLIKELKAKGFDVVTAVTPATHFYEAEDYHQDYYRQKGSLPYCHGYTKRF